MKQQGLVQVYTGDGKGKSTAAIGQLIRCAGHGYKVGIVCFFKDPQSFGDGEFDSLEARNRCVFLRPKASAFLQGSQSW